MRSVTPLTAEQQELAAQHFKAACSLAWRRIRLLASRKIPHDAAALIEAAMFGLVDAAARWTPGRGAKFWTFAYPRIRGALSDEVRWATSRPVVEYQWYDLDKIDPSPGADETFDDNEFVDWCLLRVPEQHRAAVRRWIEGESIERAFRECSGMGQSTGSNVIRDAVTAIRSDIAGGLCPWFDDC